MSYERRLTRRWRHPRRRGAEFVVGFLTGGVIGLGFGVLFAPKSGAQLRRQIAGQANVRVPGPAPDADADPLSGALDPLNVAELAPRQRSQPTLHGRRTRT